MRRCADVVENPAGLNGLITQAVLQLCASALLVWALWHWGGVPGLLVMCGAELLDWAGKYVARKDREGSP